jgi:hypothetical protein
VRHDDAEENMRATQARQWESLTAVRCTHRAYFVTLDEWEISGAIVECGNYGISPSFLKQWSARNVWTLASSLGPIRLELNRIHLDQTRSIPRFASLFVIAALLT